MKSFFIHLVFLFFLIFVGSCTKNKQNSQALIEESPYIISTKNNILKTVRYDNFLNNLKFVKLETAQHCLIGGEIKNVKIDNDLIFILDNNTNLFVFELNGKFLRKIGRRGNGPGEVQSISNFCLNKEMKEIMLFDITKNTILIFGYRGNFVKSIKFNQRLDIKKFEALLKINAIKKVIKNAFIIQLSFFI